MTFLRPLATAALLALPSGVLADTYAETFPNHPGSGYADVDEMLAGLEYRRGSVPLPGGQATLTIPRGFYFLDAADSAVVLTDLWGNPPGGGTLGMVFPDDRTPFEAWGVEFTWDDIGYVSDEDAGSYDYDDLLVQMQRDTAEESRDRDAQGYGTVELIGWAEAPGYDMAERKLHWALELEFDDDPEHVLNYQLRALGREGVLQATFIADMTDLPEIDARLPEVAEMIAFNPGRTYADFNPSVDTVAAVGIGGLIAGKAAGKLGILAMGAVLLKKFWFVLLLPLIWLKNLFAGRRV